MLSRSECNVSNPSRDPPSASPEVWTLFFLGIVLGVLVMLLVLLGHPFVLLVGLFIIFLFKGGKLLHG